MIAWFTRNHVAANLMLVTIVFAGLISLTTKLPLEIFPEIEVNVITISVTQRAAAPEDMEQGVASRIEDAIADLPDIEKLSSRSAEQVATITVELVNGADPQEVLNEVKSRVDALSTLPSDAERPQIELALRKREVLNLIVSGDLDEKELSQVARRIRDEVVLRPGVTQSDIEGIRPYEITLSVSENTLRKYRLTQDDIGQAIQSEAIDLSAGQLRSDSGEIRVRAKSQAYDYDDFKNIVIKRFSDGSTLYLDDLASINDGFEEDPIFTRYNGQRAAVVNVYRVGQESVIDISQEVRRYLDELRPRLPPTVEVSIWDDDSRIVKARLSTLLNSAWQGAIMVMILLSLFLRPTIALWVVVGIPVSFMGALAVMPQLDITINILSLFAFILVLGIVVDDAIVTAENVFTYYRKNPNASGLEAAIEGTKEVAVPVTFGILTTVCAFLPFTMMSGNMATIYQQIAFVVVPVLLFSLVESKFILPAHLKHLKRPSEDKDNALNRFQHRISTGLEHFVERYYQPFLSRCLERRYTTILGFIALFVIAYSLLGSGWTRFVFFPNVPSESATAELTMQTGTPIEVTEAAIERIEQAAQDMREKYLEEDGTSAVRNILSTIGATGGGGSGSSNKGRVRFEITPPEERNIDISPTELVNEWRRSIGPIAGVETLDFDAQIGRSGDPIDVQITGNDYRALEEVVTAVRDKLATFSGVFEIADSLSDGKLELIIELKPQAQMVGLTLQRVTQQVRQALDGYQAQRIQRGQDDVRVMVRYPKADRSSIDQLDEMRLTTPSGDSVRFADVASYHYTRGPSAIYHVDRRRAVNITADIDKSTVNATSLNRELTEWLSDYLSAYPGISFSLEGEAREQKDSQRDLTVSGLLVLFAIYALLAIPFKSYGQPFIVMSIIPFAFIGALAGHWVMGHSVSMMSIMGMMALIGIVVNDSLVLVDYINQKVRSGLSLFDAVYHAGGARFRAVLLTSLTTFVGLVPLLFEKSTQAQFLIPMAISLGFGILFATFVTLILVPCHYLVLEDIQRGIKQLLSKLSLNAS
ncbi:RND family efflux transporter [gamma proteobacterium HTCC5015]|nr:RND family efflux transporter [gamma proteobacterium HTCC5015]